MLKLKNVMLINAVSSGATGAILWIVPDRIAGIFGTAQTVPFIGVGIFLMLFAGGVYLASRNTDNTAATRTIILCDSLWVVVSLGIVLFQVFDITFIGYALISLVAVWVAVMAWLQLRGLNKVIKMNKAG